MFWIDIVLAIVFILVVILCYFRGFFKTILTFVKLILSGVIAYFLQGFLGPVIGNLLPISYSDNMDMFLNFIPANLVEEFKANTGAVIGSIIAFILVFIVLYVVFTIVGSMLNNKISKHRLTRVVNKLGGIVVGVFLGIFAVFIVSFIIAFFLMIYNPTIAIATIYNSFLLKLFVADSITAILESIVSQFG